MRTSTATSWWRSARRCAGTLEALPARERLILRLRFEEDLTQAEIAEHVGVSQMHVSRLLRRSLDRLSAAGAAAA